MAQINKPDTYFNTKLYAGTNTPQSITGVGFQPDWTWIKVRNVADNHYIYDSVRGATKFVHSDLTSAEGTLTNGLTSFDSDGFSLGDSGSTNNASNTFVSWNWLASNTTASNTDGDITSTVSANTTSGFSIVSYTTSSSGTDTVGHGLGVKPDVLITKSRDNAYNWDILHKSINDNGVGRMTFTTNGYLTGSSPYANTTPTASVFSFNANFYGASDNVTYCFAEKKGFSKFGSYTGNGSTDGTFVYTGFKPAFLITKMYNTTGGSWGIVDGTRNEFNVVNKWNFADSSGAEFSAVNVCDFLSNGFKFRAVDTSSNSSGNSYIYMAFAENPFVTSTGIPTVAR